MHMLLALLLLLWSCGLRLCAIVFGRYAVCGFRV